MTTTLARPPGRIRCARCGGVVRWRRVRDERYEPAEEWAFPASCSHCGAKAQPGDISIAVVLED